MCAVVTHVILMWQGVVRVNHLASDYEPGQHLVLLFEMRMPMCSDRLGEAADRIGSENAAIFDADCCTRFFTSDGQCCVCSA